MIKNLSICRKNKVEKSEQNQYRLFILLSLFFFNISCVHTHKNEKSITKCEQIQFTLKKANDNHLKYVNKAAKILANSKKIKDDHSKAMAFAESTINAIVQSKTVDKPAIFKARSDLVKIFIAGSETYANLAKVQSDAAKAFSNMSKAFGNAKKVWLL